MTPRTIACSIPKCKWLRLLRNIVVEIPSPSSASRLNTAGCRPSARIGYPHMQVHDCTTRVIENVDLVLSRRSGASKLYILLLTWLTGRICLEPDGKGRAEVLTPRYQLAENRALFTSL
ncbi:hypothetical protein TWF594_009086 [Orbilia oligospora]|nr:hypothetical protein TWF103_011523 [Orbilia oligospora]KAF3150443.1 hypothetical protein TWF594_009086 [Orbilia oligospora]